VVTADDGTDPRLALLAILTMAAACGLVGCGPNDNLRTASERSRSVSGRLAGR
jgi:hypothetical protein